MADQGRVNAFLLQVHFFQNTVDFFGLPVDDAGQNERQAIAGVDLLVQFAGINAASASVIDIPGQRMQLFNFKQTQSDTGPQLGLAHIAEDKLGFEHAAQFPVGPVEAMFGAESSQAFERHRRRGVSTFERGIKLPHAVPLLDNQRHVNGAVGPSD